jgi:hypothetical protein
MAIDPQEFAQLLGAKIAGEVPDVGGGPFGMARLAHVMHQTLTPSQGERPGRPTNPNWATRRKVPMSTATLRKLIQLAEGMSTPERKVSPMQVAAQLLEEAISQTQELLPATSLEVIGVEEPQTPSQGNKKSLSGKDKGRGRGGRSASPQKKA